MNKWDLFTWANVVVLAGGALIVFGFFLKDVRGVLKGMSGEDDPDRGAPPR